MRSFRNELQAECAKIKSKVESSSGCSVFSYTRIRVLPIADFALAPYTKHHQERKPVKEIPRKKQAKIRVDIVNGGGKLPAEYRNYLKRLRVVSFA